MSQADLHGPCEACGSSDARTVYDSGWAHCFSCGKNEKVGDSEGSPAFLPRRKTLSGAPLLEKVDAVPLKKRCISQATCERFGYFVTMDTRGQKVQVAPYHDTAGRLVAQKVRPKDKSKMFVTGKMPGTLFGQHLWKPQDNRKLCITEGEIDALSIYETMGNWAVVSVPNGAQGAAKAVSQNLDFVEGFGEVVLCFDMDEPGQEAAEAVAQLLTPGKARIMALPLNDANEMLQEGRKQELKDAFWNARPYQPDGLHDASELWEEVVAPNPPAFFHYPWPSVDSMLKGARLQEIVIWTAGSGVGKSTATREVTRAALKQGIKVGVIALEESIRDTVRHQMALELNTHLHLGGADVDRDRLRAAFDAVSPGLVVHDHWGSLEKERLANLVRYMAVGKGCQMIVLDHISMVVSGSELDNERKELDILMTRLRTLAQDLKVNIQVVSHIKRKDGKASSQISKTDLRGSAALEQLADQIVALERDDQDEDESDITVVRVLKNRPAGWNTGRAGSLKYLPETGRLIEAEDSEFFGEEGATDDGF